VTKNETLKTVIAIDPGDRRIGIAISDETGSLARSLVVIIHKSRHEDAERIIKIATDHDAGTVIIGAAYGDDGKETPASRKATRLADEIQSKSNLKVAMWDESGSTQKAKEIKILTGAGKKQRRGHQDSTAAAIILQDYLDSNQFNNQEFA
jgi:putative Holliday junction resolvase